jgi:Na+-driven multidrug efflux pump
MSEPLAKFTAFTALLVSLYLAIAAFYLGQDFVSEAHDALVKGLWVAFGASLILALCAIVALTLPVALEDQ